MMMMNETIEGQEVKQILMKNGTPVDAKPIVKVDIPELKGNTAFVLENVLSESECQYIIDEGERLGFDKLQYYREKYRGNTRILVKSYSLSELVFARIKQYLPQEIIINSGSDRSRSHLKAFEGTWRLDSVNELWRLCKYNDGGAFAPHYDGYYTRDSYNRSYLTFMIYLSGGIQGGNTRFLDKQNNVIVNVTPKPGAVLVFQHDMWHDGEQVLGGKKYICRTDVMYKRDGEVVEQRQAEREARKICQEAMELEGSNAARAAELYRRAFKLCPELEQEY